MLNFYIPHRKEGEKIILLLRRHYLILLSKLAFWATVAILPPIFYLLFKDTLVLKSLFGNQYLEPITMLFISTYYLYVWLFAFHSFVDYYLDVWVVTSHRIINMEQKGLFARSVSEQKLFRVQDVTAELKGVFSTLFDFGTVYIQTAGEEPRFTFKQIPNPNRVAKKINLLSEENKKFQQILNKE